MYDEEIPANWESCQHCLFFFLFLLKEFIQCVIGKGCSKMWAEHHGSQVFPNSIIRLWCRSCRLLGLNISLERDRNPHVYHQQPFIVKIARAIIINLYRGAFLKRTKKKTKTPVQINVSTSFYKNKTKTLAKALSRIGAATKRRILGDVRTVTPGPSPVEKRYTERGCVCVVSSSQVQQSLELLEKQEVTEVSVCSSWISCASDAEIGTRSAWTCAVETESGNAWTSVENGNAS